MQKLDFNKDGKLVAYTDNGCTDGKSVSTEVRGTFKVSANPLNSIAMSKEQLQEVADLIAANILFCAKEVLTSDEAYMDIRVLQDLRRKALAYYDVKQVNED